MKHLQLVIDDGSNFIKTAHKNDDDQIVINSFPSRVIRKSLIDNQSGLFNASSYEVNGQPLAVTRDASNTVPTNNPDYHASDINLALVTHAVRLIGADSVDIYTTLPVSKFFMPDGSKNESLINAKVENLKGKITAKNGDDLAEIKKVFVVPEGVPAFAHAKDDLNLENGRYLIVEIGGTTTELIIFNEDSGIEQFTSLDIGAITMLNKFKAHCVALMNLPSMTDNIAFKGLLSGTVSGVDVSSVAKSCIDEFHQSLDDNIKIMGDLRLFDAVIYSGGGAELLNLTGNALKTDNPQFDNALGCLDAVGV